MSKLVKRHEEDYVHVHIETADEKFFRLMNTPIRFLRRTGGSCGITIPPTLIKKLGLDEGDRLRILMFRSLDELESYRAQFEKMNGAQPFIVLIKWVWGEEGEER